MLSLKKYNSNLGRKTIKVTRVFKIGLLLFVTILQTTMVSIVWAASSSDRIFLLDGSILNGEPVNSSNNEITLAPGETITGTLKIRMENDHSPNAIVPVIYIISWGDHASSWVSVEVWAPTGISYYDVPISLTAPGEGTYYIIFGSQGQTHGSYIASLTGWFLGYNSWNDGIDLADMDEIDLGDCMTSGFATLPVLETGGVYGDCGTGCTYIKVNVITEPTGLLDIDIKPGSCPNPLNVKDKGVLPVAILGSEDLDVFNIDPDSVRLEGVAPVRYSYEDVSQPVSNQTDDCDCTTEGPDGYIDLVLKFDTQEIVTAIGSVYDGDELLLTLTGEDLIGTPIEGTDCVVIIAKGVK
jgi:hypothetical protein